MDTIEPVSENVTKSSFAAMAGVLLSRASGVIRTMVVNATFGMATTLDAFNAAFRMPNSLRDLFADGALSAAFMTALVAKRQKGIEAERELIAIVMGFFGTITLLLAILGAYFSPQIIDLITDSTFKESGGLPIAIVLFQLLVFYLPLTMMNAVVMAILGVHGHSFRAMNGSIFLSVGMILGALALAPMYESWKVMGVLGLATGALLGAAFQMIYQMQPLFRLKLLPPPNFNVRLWLTYKPLRKILSQMAPRAMGQGALVIALGINTYFATRIGVGALTYIVTAVTIIQVPIGLFGVATGFAALPVLASALTKKDSGLFSKLLVEGLKTSFWLATITIVGFALLIIPFYVVLFQHGKITYADTINNGLAICIYATGIILASGNKVLINTLYALNATRQIVYNAVIYLLVNALLNIWLVPIFGLIGIGFSFGIATSLDFWLNFIFIHRYFHLAGYTDSPYQQGGRGFALKIVILNLFGFAICFTGIWLIKHFWARFFELFHLPLNFWVASIILAVGGSILLAAASVVIFYLGPSHLKQIMKR